MKESQEHLTNIKAAILKAKLKQLHNEEDENSIIRLHRAISWVKCAEEQDGILLVN